MDFAAVVRSHPIPLVVVVVVVVVVAGTVAPAGMPVLVAVAVSLPAAVGSLPLDRKARMAVAVHFHPFALFRPLLVDCSS